MTRTTSSQRGASRTGRSTAASKRTEAGAGRARRTTPRATSRSAPKRPGPRRSPRRRRSPVAAPWVPFVVIALAVAVVWSLYPALRLQYVESRRVAGLQAEYASLKARNDALRAQVADLKTPAGVERAAREKLGLARDGENVYVVIPSDGASASADSAPVGKAASTPGLLEALLDAVFGVSRR